MTIPKNSKELNEDINKKVAEAQKAYTKLLKEFEKKIELLYLAALASLNSGLKDMYDKVGSDLSNVPSENIELISKNKKLAKLRKQIKDELKIFTKAKNQIQNGITSSLKQGYYSNTWSVEASAGINFKVPFLNEATIKASLENPLDLVKWEERLRNNLRNTISTTRATVTNGLIQGNGFQETARSLKKQLNISYKKAIRIVRTESHRAQVMGMNDSYNRIAPKASRLGMEPRKVLRAVHDKRTRQQSASMDGQVAGKDGLFVYPNGTRALPGQTGNPAYDINDRELIVTEFGAWSPDMREENGVFKSQVGQSFGDWAKSTGLTKNIYGQKFDL
jgi:hypothetical protein